MLKRWLSVATVALLALVVLAACGGDDDSAEADVTRIPDVANAPVYPPLEGSPAAAAAGPAASPAGAQAAAASPAAGAPAAAGSITIEGFDIGWTFNGQSTTPGNPITVTVAPGTTIDLPNTGVTLHNFAVDALGIDVDMPVGETVTATIPADAEPGEYEFYCNVPGHKAAGMVGTLVVQAAGAAAPPAPADGAAPPPAGEAPAGDAPAAEAAGPITIEGFDIGWTFNGQSTTPGSPITVTVSPGTEISLPNVGVTLHNFAVDALGIDVDMPVGETVTATIPADAEPGEYEFYCNVPGHKPAGMVGTLVIQ